MELSDSTIKNTTLPFPVQAPKKLKNPPRKKIPYISGNGTF